MCACLLCRRGVRFGTDYTLDVTFTKAQTDAAPDGWFKIDQIVVSESITYANREGVFLFYFAVYHC